MSTKSPKATPSAAAGEPANITVEQLSALLRADESPAAGSPVLPAPEGETGLDAESGAEEQPEPVAEAASEHSAEIPATGPDEVEEAGETGEEPEEDGDEEEDAAASGGGGGRSVRKLQKRLSKLVKQRDDERLLRAHAEEQLAAYRAKTPEAPAARPVEANFGNHADVQRLNEELGTAESVLAWCARNPEGAETDDGKGHQVIYTPEQVSSIRSGAERQRIERIAERAALVARLREGDLVQRKSSYAQAVKFYPWMADTASPEYQEAVAIVQEMPWLAQRPDMALLTGDILTQRKARSAQAKKPVVATRKIPPARSPSLIAAKTANAAPRASGGTSAELAEAEAAFTKSGKLEDMQRVLRIKARARLPKAA